MVLMGRVKGHGRTIGLCVGSSDANYGDMPRRGPLAAGTWSSETPRLKMLLRLAMTLIPSVGMLTLRLTPFKVTRLLLWSELRREE